MPSRSSRTQVSKAVVIDAADDYWTCSKGARCAGVWVPAEFAQEQVGSWLYNPWWCRTINHDSFTKCRNCGQER